MPEAYKDVNKKVRKVNGESVKSQLKSERIPVVDLRATRMDTVDAIQWMMFGSTECVARTDLLGFLDAVSLA